MYPVFLPMPMYPCGDHYGNVPQYFKNKYGHGYIDFAHHPKPIDYPIHTIEYPINRKEGFFRRLFRKCYFQ